MATQTVNWLDTISNLPIGGTLILSDVSWDEYQRLVAEIVEWNGVRVTYDQGRLEIMSPSSEHERAKEMIALLVHVLADETGITLESLGSTTYQQEWLQRGLEPDCCFYVQNAARIIGVADIRREKDPPPDLAVEVDVSHASAIKLKIYAGMGVPEIWLYDRKALRMHQLVDDQYVSTNASLTFPILTSDILTCFIKQGLELGQTAALKSFRQWLSAHRAESHEQSNSGN